VLFRHRFCRICKVGLTRGCSPVTNGPWKRAGTKVATRIPKIRGMILGDSWTHVFSWARRMVLLSGAFGVTSTGKLPQHESSPDRTPIASPQVLGACPKDDSGRGPCRSMFVWILGCSWSVNEAVLPRRFDFQHHLVVRPHSLVVRCLGPQISADRNCRTEKISPKWVKVARDERRTEP
jgi:hypothetical protein